MRSHLLSLFLAGIAFVPASSWAWDYERHRLVNDLALGTLPKDFPAFAQAAKERILFLSGEPDRWRNNNSDRALRHTNNPDHYFDVDDLPAYGLKPELLSHFRYEFVARLALERKARNLPEPKPSANLDRLDGLPGFLPWSITEQYGKVRSSFSYLKVFVELGTPEEIANAQANVVYQMGVLSHYIGDAAQPLHTTRHFNGWKGENPKGYTTRPTFHAWIDGNFFKANGAPDAEALHKSLRPAKRLETPVARDDASGHFQLAMQYVTGQFKLVEPLYELEKAGKLSGENAKEGRAFLEAQLGKASQLLADMWYTAWLDAPPDRFLQSYLSERKLKKP